MGRIFPLDLDSEDERELQSNNFLEYANRKINGLPELEAINPFIDMTYYSEFALRGKDYRYSVVYGLGRQKTFELARMTADFLNSEYSKTDAYFLKFQSDKLRPEKLDCLVMYQGEGPVRRLFAPSDQVSLFCDKSQRLYTFISIAQNRKTRLMHDLEEFILANARSLLK